MKLLHIHSGNLFGGVETLLITLAKQQSLCPQMQPHFALCFENKLAAELRAAGATLHLLGEVRVSRPWKIWKARSQLAQLLRQERFDVVICHSCWTQAIFGSVVRAHGLPLVFWCHDILNGQHWLERWARQTLPDLAIANSRFTLASVAKLYPTVWGDYLYLPVSSTALSNSGDIRRTVRSQLATPDDAVVIVQASRLERWKGQSVLLSALAQLQELPNWNCWIAGGVQRVQERAYWQELQTQAQRLGIADRVQFLGQRADIPHLLVSADIYCQPNTSPEPFGIVLVEALHAGLPIVTTAIGGALEVVNEDCGRLVASGDAAALSHALRSLLINANARSELSAAGPARATRLCNPDSQLAQLDRLLTQLVKQEVTA